MKQRKLPKIVYIGWTEPGNVSGATLALMRHLFADKQWNVLVITDKPYKGVGEKDQWLEIKRSWIHKRLSRTRFRRIVAQYEMILEPYLIALKINKVIKIYDPDIILTIPDNTLSWTARLISEKLNIPLISNFQDWWPRGMFYALHEKPYLFTRSFLETRLRLIYKHSSIAFCTSEGFRAFLGNHPCAPILYPCPGERPLERPLINYVESNQTIRLIYAGTVTGPYGKKVLSLAKAIASREDITFHVYGGKPDWSKEDIQWAKNLGIYRGFVKHELIKQYIRDAHVGLVVMAFNPELEIMMKTSFTTKFLEYTQLAKPVIVWGPNYCQPVKIAKKTMAGLIVDNESADSVVSTLLRFKDRALLKQCADKSWDAATTIFDSEVIQGIFSSNIYSFLGIKK